MPDKVNLAMFGLRMALALVFIAHGAKHAVRKEKTTNWARSIGFRQPSFQWLMMSATEIGVGLLMALGLLTTLAAAGIVGTLFVAFWTVHRFAGFWITARPDEGWEYVLTLTAIAFAVAIVGPGEWSVDDAMGIATDFDGWVGLWVAAAGILVGIGQVLTFWRPAEAEGSG